MRFILGVSFYTIVLDGFLKRYFTWETSDKKWYIFWKGEYEGEFPDFLGQKMFLHFEIFKNNTFLSWV